MGSLTKIRHGFAIIVMTLLLVVVTAVVATAATVGEVTLKIKIEKESHLIAVEETINQPPRGTYGFSFRDLGGVPERFKSYSILADGKELRIASGRGQWDFQVAVPRRTAKLQLSYTIDPRWSPPGSPHTETRRQKSFMRPAAALLRGSVVFPEWEFEIPRVKVKYEVPEGWTVIAPWQQKDDWFVTDPLGLLGDYIAIGPFIRETVSQNGVDLTVAVWNGDGLPKPKLPTPVITRAFSWLVEALGDLPDPQARSVAVFPRELLGGGASGYGSLVTIDSVPLAIHEIVHWWNGGAFHTARDATWFGEGVTEYFTYKAIWKCGAWKREQFEESLRRIQSRVQELEKDAPYSLSEASEMYWKQADPWHDVIYQKGALFGMVLDGYIQSETGGQYSIEDLLKELSRRGKDVGTAEILRVLDSEFDVDAGGLVEEYVKGARRIDNVE